ncbi:ScyD/ScyE family protein [Arthrobacter sp. AL12]|uniref:ScyD/ScyE family protein n=1 Tax=Arthrobacter sp. AL12 TaxID=3042241 RepID=UPI00249CAC21|nr:ScyD/ScyE family protein [Arthrobacter sp. AL12]MDI3211973.1 ScyD/ScyE family protein [Arthrobacter sp. AL12]
MRKKLSLPATAATVAVFLATGSAAGAAPDGPSVAAARYAAPVPLTGGLVGPLHVSAGRDGSVTVSESFAGRLTRVDSEGNKKVLYESPDWSVAGNDRRDGRTYFLESQGAGPHPAELAGHVRIIDDDGRQRTLGDFAALETEENSDGDTRYGFRDLPAGCEAELPVNMPAGYRGEVDSHPYGIAVTEETIYVADAGANSVVSVDTRSGETRTVAVLPPRPYKITTAAAASNGLPDCVVGTTYDFEAVPTDVAVGPDGWLYITSLPGGPEDPALGARGAIFKVDPDDDEVKLVADEIMTPTGLALNKDGDLYVASLFGEGVLRIDPHSGDQTVVLGAGFAADVDLRGDSLYATVNALPGPDGKPDGQVMQLNLRDG